MASPVNSSASSGAHGVRGPVSTLRVEAGRVWARRQGVSLHLLDSLPDALSLRRALADGVERGYDGPLSAFPDSARLLLVRAEKEDVGLLAIAPGPGQSAATLLVVAVAREARGRSLGLRAVLASEHRLRRDGVHELYASVPRSNGRGVYFWLRAGYRPLVALPAGVSVRTGETFSSVADHGGTERGFGWFYRPLERPRARSRRSRR